MPIIFQRPLFVILYNAKDTTQAELYQRQNANIGAKGYQLCICTSKCNVTEEKKLVCFAPAF